MRAAPRIDHWEMLELMEEGAQILDALPPEDYARKHIEGAINVPLEKFSNELIRGLDERMPTITYCADNQCDLSARLAARLIYEGFEHVYEYAPSLADWMAYGQPIEGSEADIVRAGHLAKRNPLTCQMNGRLQDIANLLSDGELCVVTDTAGVLLGRVTAMDIANNPEGTCADVAHPGPSTFRPDVPISELAEWFERRNKDAFIITTPDGKPFGVLYRADVESLVRSVDAAESQPREVSRA